MYTAPGLFTYCKINSFMSTGGVVPEIWQPVENLKRLMV